MNRVQEFCDKLSFPVVVLSCDAYNPVILAANEQHSKLSGFSKEEIVGRSPRIFDGTLTPDIAGDVQRSVRTSDFWAGETVNYTKDRSPYRVAVNIIGIVVAGERYYATVKQKMGLH